MTIPKKVLKYNSKYAILTMNMNVFYYRTSSGREPVREYVNDLPRADRIIIAGDLELIREYGIVAAPVVTRKLLEKLWEIKTGTRHQQRIFYCVMTGDALVLLHACKKQKEGAQRGDVDLAFKRMKEVLR
jgi:phage-related protein